MRAQTKARDISKVATQMAKSAGFSRQSRRFMGQTGLVLADVFETTGLEGDAVSTALEWLERNEARVCAKYSWTSSHLSRGRYILARVILAAENKGSHVILEELLLEVTPELRSEVVALASILSYSYHLESFRWDRNQLSAGASKLAALNSGEYAKVVNFEGPHDVALAEKFSLSQECLFNNEELYSFLPRPARTRVERSLKSLVKRAA